MIPARPLFPWAGGKRGLLPLLRPRLPKEFGAWLEPFAGGLAVGLDQRPERLIVGDSNAELLRCYEGVRDDVGGVLEALAGLEVSRGTYLHQRDAIDPEQLSLVERAARFIYLQNLGYNGLSRTNGEGKSTVAFGGRTEWKVDPRNMRAVSEVLAGAELLCADYSETLARAQPGDFVFCDSPYDGVFSDYSATGFDDAQQRRLAETVRTLAEKSVKVLCTNNDTPLVRQLYAGFRIEQMPVRRTIAGRGVARNVATEAAIMTYEPEDRANVAAKTYSFSSVKPDVAAKERQGIGMRTTARATAQEADQQTEFCKQLLQQGVGRAGIQKAFRARFNRSARTCDTAISQAKTAWAVAAVKPTASDMEAERVAFLAKLEGDIADMKAAGTLVPVAAIRRIQMMVLGVNQVGEQGANGQPPAPGVSVHITNQLPQTSPEDRAHRLKLLKRVIAQAEREQAGGSLDDDDPDEQQPAMIVTTGESASSAS